MEVGGGGFLRVQLEELERSMDSDSCQNSLRYTISHMLFHAHTHTQAAAHHPLMLLNPEAHATLSQKRFRRSAAFFFFFLKAPMDTHDIKINNLM